MPVMAWDAARGKLVVFGGMGENGVWGNRIQDTWEWDSVNGWVEQFPVTVPDRRWLTNGVYVPGTGVVFHGGNSVDAGGNIYVDNQTWAFDGTDWSVLATGPTADERHAHLPDRRQRPHLLRRHRRGRRGGHDGHLALRPRHDDLVAGR